MDKGTQLDAMAARLKHADERIGKLEDDLQVAECQNEVFMEFLQSSLDERGRLMNKLEPLERLLKSRKPRNRFAKWLRSEVRFDRTSDERFRLALVELLGWKSP